MSDNIIPQNIYLKVPFKIDDCLIPLIRNANHQITLSIKKGQVEQNAIITHYNDLMSKANHKVNLLGMVYYANNALTKRFFSKLSIAELKQITQKNNIKVIDKRCKDAFVESIADRIERDISIKKALEKLVDNVIQLSVKYYQEEIEIEKIPLVYYRLLFAFIHRNQFVDLSNLFQEEILEAKSYQDFLNSRYWEFVKSKVLQRDNYKCSICQATQSLHVHHKNYSHHGNELNHIEDLITLCSSCHKKIHS